MPSHISEFRVAAIHNVSYSGLSKFLTVGYRSYLQWAIDVSYNGLSSLFGKTMLESPNVFKLHETKRGVC